MLEGLSEVAGAPELIVPRVSLVLAREGARPAIWMGGARALRGDELLPVHLGDAWLFDTAGDMPAGHRAAAARTIDFVFADSEETPPGFERLLDVVREVRGCGAPGGPAAIYVVCSQGLNRSGLLTGLMLRALGFSAEEVKALRKAQVV